MIGITSLSVHSNKKYRILLFITCLLCIAGAAIGPVLRWAAIAPVNADYRNLMHAHSHTMLMGWLFNGFILAFCRRMFHRMPNGVFIGMLLTSLFTVMQLVLFPGHGYDRIVILLLVLYTLASYYVLYEIYCAAGKLDAHRLTRLLIRIAILFYLLSTLCLFGLGPWVAGAFRIRVRYDLLIQLYLHFQYNGFFWFGFLALLANRNAWVSKLSNRFACFLMAIGTLLLTGFLIGSIPGAGTYTGAAGGLLQLLAGLMLLGMNRPGRSGMSSHSARPGRVLRVIAGLFLLKLVLQPAGFSPAVTMTVLGSRPLMVAWLHFSFLGLYTPLVWYMLRSGEIPGKLWAGYAAALGATLAGLVVPYLFHAIPLKVLLYLNWWNFTAVVLLFLFLTAITFWILRSHWVKSCNKT